MGKKYISLKKWADKNNVAVQSVYRWARENKFTNEEIVKEKIEKEVLKIDENTKIPIGCGERKNI